MARVAAVVEAEVDNGRLHPTVVMCEWHSFDDRGAILQLDTRGSDDREIPGKLSQTLQFDEKSAAELLRVITMVFPSLRTQR